MKKITTFITAEHISYTHHDVAFSLPVEDGNGWLPERPKIIPNHRCFDAMKLHIWHVLQLSEKGKSSAHRLVPEGFYMISERCDS